MTTPTTQRSEFVADPVSHISISGVHGRDELNERLAHASEYHEQASHPLPVLLLGAAIGATLMYLAKR